MDADGSRGRSNLTRPAISNEHDPQLPSGLNTTDLTDGSKTKKGDNSSDTSLKEDELRAKEKTLTSKERRLRDLQKKLNSKEINLGDTLDRIEYSKAFISQMENKIKELETSNKTFTA